uniref:C2H2-type domain-containing protein n=1 Tax=Panagrolaimus sp. JU765 TaxID=591449 RepID=A0AC34RJZ6_9BILA
MAQTVTPILPHYEYYVPSDYTYPRCNTTVETYYFSANDQSDNGQFMSNNVFFVEECYDSLGQSNSQCPILENDSFVCEDSQTPVYSPSAQVDAGFNIEQIPFVTGSVDIDEQQPVQEVVFESYQESTQIIPFVTGSVDIDEQQPVQEVVFESYQESTQIVEPAKKRSAVEMNCQICGLFLKHPSKIQAHMRTHTGERPFVCEHCGKSFTQRTPWRCHVRRHLGDTPYQCSKCEKSFPNASSRKAHEVRVHEKAPKVENPEFLCYANPTMNFVDDVKLDEKKYEPEMISEIIDDVVSGKVQIEDDVKFIKKPGRMPTLEICSICGLHLKYPSRIEQHMRSHSGLKPFLCKLCGQSFASASTLKVHQGRFHLLDRPYPCRWQCGKKFPARSHRNEHEKIVHSKIKRKAHEVRVHEKAPKVENPEFLCYANPTMNFVDDVKLDEKKYEPEMISEIIDDVVSGKVQIEDDVKFIKKPGRMPTLEICSICGLHLKYPSRIEQHMRSHSGLKPFLCKLCGQSFASASTLKVHQGRFHLLDRPYPCRWQCGKKFPARSHRNEHEKIVHSKIKRYQCGVSNCNKLFTRRLYLVKHLEKCHLDVEDVSQVKGFRVVAVPYEEENGTIKVPSNFDLTFAKIYADVDGTPYVVDVLGPIENKLERNPMLIEDAVLQMLCGSAYPQQESPSESGNSLSPSFSDDLLKARSVSVYSMGSCRIGFRITRLSFIQQKFQFNQIAKDL